MARSRDGAASAKTAGRFDPKPGEADRATAAILLAALELFGRNGFKATRLSEIAVLAGVSRPTLYARYEDKTRLFRAVVEQGYREAIRAAQRTVDAGGAFPDVLRDLLLDYYGGLFDRFHDLPQIDELALVQSEHAHDVVEAGRLEMQRLLGRVIRDYADQGAIDLSALGMPVAQIVDLLRLSPLALKPPRTTRAQYRRRLKNLAAVTASALRGGD